MTPDQIERAASALVAARRGSPIATLPGDAIPQTEADAYQIQDAVIAKLGEKIGGWKTGVLPTGGPFVAPIFASAMPPKAPAMLPAQRLQDHLASNWSRRSAFSFIVRCRRGGSLVRVMRCSPPRRCTRRSRWSTRAIRTSVHLNG